MNDFDCTAPEGKFRVIGCDTFDNTSWYDSDCDTREEAKKRIQELGGTMLIAYMYDSKGTCLGSAGTF